MKRFNNLYGSIYSIENLKLADNNARKNKSKQYGIFLHDKNRVKNIEVLHEELKNKTYKTSTYTTFKIYEPKERIIYRLPYYPDRITHHAIMNVLEPIFKDMFISNTYSCIKGKGILAAAKAVRKALKDEENTKYCLKLDIKKFYPSINHDILKTQLTKKFKDRDLLWLLNGIIDSADGVPIGNYLSQYLANFYLNGLDHWIKEVKLVKYYFRYADDMVFLSSDKQYLHQLLADIKEYLSSNLNLELKDNYQLYPVEARSIDFVGYRFYHTHTLLRKRIKKRFARMLKRNPKRSSISSYNGWVKHCDGKHLMKKLLNKTVW